jgi:hypothetical protein
MRRIPLAVPAALLLAFGCTEPSYPKVGGAWRYASTLTFPSDFSAGTGEPYVCTYLAALSLDQSSNTFEGTYDSLSISCSSGGISTGLRGTVINGTVTRGGELGFYFDTPNWLMVGTIHGDSMGGTAIDSVSGLSGTEAARGPWSACRSRACQ